MNYKIEWETDTPELNEQQTKKLTGELAYLTEQLDQPGDLFFHHFWLTEDTDGPVIMIYGKEDVSDTLYMSYYAETNWITLDQENGDAE